MAEHLEAVVDEMGNAELLQMIAFSWRSRQSEPDVADARRTEEVLPLEPLASTRPSARRTARSARRDREPLADEPANRFQCAVDRRRPA